MMVPRGNCSMQPSICLLKWQTNRKHTIKTKLMPDFPNSKKKETRDMPLNVGLQKRNEALLARQKIYNVLQLKRFGCKDCLRDFRYGIYVMQEEDILSCLDYRQNYLLITIVAASFIDLYRFWKILIGVVKQAESWSLFGASLTVSTKKSCI